MKKYGLHGQLKANAGQGDQLATILLEAARLMATARGCHLYLVSKGLEDPDAVWITEVWDRKEDHDNSLQIEGVGELISRAWPLLAAPPQHRMELEVPGGRGLGE